MKNWAVHLKWLLPAWLFGFHTLALSQTIPVSNRLFQINEQFTQGRLTSCIEESRTLLQERLNRQERFETLRLLALSLHTIGELDSCEKVCSQMLRIKPDYQSFPYPDPLTFRQFIAQFEVRRLFTFFLNSGVAFTNTQIPELFTQHIGTTRLVNEPGLWIQGGLEYAFHKRWDISLSLAYESLRFGQDYWIKNELIGTSREQQNMLNYQLGLQFHFFPKSKFDIKLGAITEYRTFQQAGLILTNENFDLRQNAFVRFQDVKAFRQNSWSGGICFAVQYASGAVLLEAGIQALQSFETSTRYNDPYQFIEDQPNYPFLYLDGPFTQSFLRLYLGVKIPLLHTAYASKK